MKIHYKSQQHKTTSLEIKVSHPVHVLKPALILNILIISKMMYRVREIVNPIRYDQQKFGKFLLRCELFSLPTEKKG
jgi:hypothetical protein